MNQTDPAVAAAKNDLLVEVAEKPYKAAFLPLALGLCLAPAIAIGFGRFAYALILPAMRTDLHWTYSQAGGLNTANAVGYLLGALIAAPLIVRLSARRALLGGLFAVVATLALSSLGSVYGLALLARALVGTAGAVAFIAGAGLSTRLGANETETVLAMGIYFSGPGIGTVLSGLGLPLLLNGAGAAQWRIAWLALAGIGLLGTALVVFASRALADAIVMRPASDAPASRPDWKAIRFGLIGYFGFGLGYIAYMTFLIAYLRAQGASTGLVTSVWTALGVAMIASGPLWRIPLAQWRGGRPMALMLTLTAIGALLPLFSEALPVLLCSALLFGLASMAVVTAITVLIRRHLPVVTWNLGIAVATIIFAVGQSLGPLGSGILSDNYGLKASLVWTAAISLLAASLVLFQKD